MEQKKSEKVLKRMAGNMMGIDLLQWPPQCAFFFYQPARPQRSAEEQRMAKERSFGRK